MSFARRARGSWSGLGDSSFGSGGSGSGGGVVPGGLSSSSAGGLLGGGGSPPSFDAAGIAAITAAVDREYKSNITWLERELAPDHAKARADRSRRDADAAAAAAAAKPGANARALAAAYGQPFSLPPASGTSGGDVEHGGGGGSQHHSSKRCVIGLANACLTPHQCRVLSLVCNPMPVVLVACLLSRQPSSPP
jgi:hypothetical protein